MFVYKQTETIRKLAYFLRKIQFLRMNNPTILIIKNAKFSGYYFYMNLNIKGDFHICMSVPLIFDYLKNENSF